MMSQSISISLYGRNILQVGAIQHSIVRSTSDKISAQRDAILEKVSRIIEAAADSGVNILCLQETWSKFE